jgi:hypothetical protein
MQTLKIKKNNPLVEEWIKKNGVKKLASGKAIGATSNGSVCAGNFSASAVMRAAANSCDDKEYRSATPGFEKENKILKEKIKRNNRKKFKNKPASEKQINYIKSLSGIVPINCSMKKASNIIQQLKRLNAEADRKTRAYNYEVNSRLKSIIKEK